MSHRSSLMTLNNTETGIMSFNCVCVCVFKLHIYILKSTKKQYVIWTKKSLVSSLHLITICKWSDWWNIRSKHTKLLNVKRIKWSCYTCPLCYSETAHSSEHPVFSWSTELLYAPLRTNTKPVVLLVCFIRMNVTQNDFCILSLWVLS